MRACPVAAAVPVAPVLSRPPQRVTVAAVTDHAVYLDTTDPDCPAVCLATRDAVRVPCALVLGDGAALPPGARVGDTGLAGGGMLTLREVAYRPSRWWRPARPRTTGRPPGARPPGPGSDPGPGHLPPLDSGTSVAVNRLGRALAANAPLTEPVTELLGRGPGLTPLGDDVLAGALITLVAAGSPAGVRLTAEVMREAFRRTTFVSAALLWHAARGECVPELAAVLAGQPGATAALLRVGHTSGVGLAHGVRAARMTLSEVDT